MFRYRLHSPDGMTSAKPHTEQIKVGEELFSAAAAGYVVAGLLRAAVGAAAGVSEADRSWAAESLDLEARLEELATSPELSEADRSWAAESLDKARAMREHKREAEDL
jgi:hypothetical protein